MRAERDRIAKGYRSEGTEQGLMIGAEADKEKQIILSEAYEKAQKIKGEGEGEAIRIYADAYERDVKFYELVRTLASYEKFLDDKTTVVLSADSELLKFINSANPDLPRSPRGRVGKASLSPLMGEALGPSEER